MRKIENQPRTAGKNMNNKYYNHFDFYSQKSTENFFLLEKFKTIQQTTDYTCGPVCCQMVLNYFGNYNYSEMQLKDIMQTKPEQIYHNIYKNKILFLKTHIDIWFLF